MLTLTINFGVPSLVEGTTLPTGTISRTGSTSAALPVTLTSTNSAIASVPATVTIAAGQVSAPFTVMAPADGVVDESATISIGATATGHPAISSNLLIVNAEVLSLRPGATSDAITLTPNGQVRRFDVAGATPEYWAPAVVNLSVDTPVDQRTALGLAAGDPYQAATSLVKVSPALRYVIGGDATASSAAVDDHPLAFASYDVDQLVIESVHVAKYQLAVDTTLAAPLAPGATSLLVTNASGWSNDAWEAGYTRALAWYGYRDSANFTYPNYTYTRNVATAGGDGLWAAGGIHYDAAAGAYRIELLAPWSGPALAAGAAIRNAQGGGQLNYPKIVATPGTVTAAKYAATIGGALWQNGLRSEATFRPGTVYIRPMAINLAAWAGASIAPENDAAQGPLNFTLPITEANAALQAVLDFDVLAKNAFGAGANVVIESVAAAQHGAASIVLGPAGRDVIHYASTAAYVGADAINYTLRDTATNATFAGRIDVVVEDNYDQQRLSKLKSIALGMLNYDSANNRFPLAPTASNFDASGNPYLSWRVHILPLMGYQSLYNQFHLNEPWNSANNLPLASQMPAEFRDPLAAANSTTTRFRIISGEGSTYYWRRVNGLLVGPRDSDVESADNLQHTLAVIETGPSAAITWTRPDLPNFNPASPLSALGTITSDWINAVTLSGSTISLPKTISPTLFASMVTVAGNELIDVPTLRRQYAALQGPAAVAALDVQLADRPLREIALGMFGHESARGRFPTANQPTWFDASGNPYLSWRVHILPYIGYLNLYERFHLNEPWNSANNLPLASLMPDIFRSPGDASITDTTRMQTFTGPAAPFRFRTAGTMQTGPTASQIVDGFENTIMFVETGSSVAVLWTKPVDVPLDTSDPRTAMGNLSGNSFRTMMFDTQTRRFSTSIAPASLAALATGAGSEVVNATSLAVTATTSTSTASNLKQIALAMINAQSAQGAFPANRFTADGTPLLSWRVRILPYLGMTSLYNQFHLNEAWDSPHNLSLLKYMPAVFRSADDPLGTMLTHVLTFVGPGAPFPSNGTSTTQGPTPSQIIDGSGATYMFVEAGADVAVPWTKPVDLPYYAANPYSQLGDLGATFYVAYFNGAIQPESSSQSISQLTTRITHQGGSSGNTPPAAPYISQSQGDARLGEFGADWFDVVLDAAPAMPLTLMLSVSNPGAALLDKQSLTFDATNWNISQRVIVRGVDDHDVNEDRIVTVIVGALQFTATIVNDDVAPPNADFNADGMVDGSDFLSWQRGLGILSNATRADGDANGDGNVASDDLTVWAATFGDGGDFLAWQRGLGTVGTATLANGDANGDRIVDSNDLAAWVTAFGQVDSGEHAIVAPAADESALISSAAMPFSEKDAVDAALAAFADETNSASIWYAAAKRRARHRAFAAQFRQL